MPYATGAAATPNQLLDAIRAFAVNQGWSVDRWTSDGLGMALSINADGIYAHFRSDPDNAGSNWYTALGLSGSTGFSAGAAWDAQPGAFPSPLYCSAQTGGNSLFPCAYHLFAQASPRFLAGCFVSPNQANTHFVVCDVQKVGVWNGGAFFGTDQHIGAALMSGYFQGGIALRADFNGAGGWHGSGGGRDVRLFGIDPVTNAFNSLAPLFPARLRINSPIDDTTPAIIGFLPSIRLVHMDAIGNGDLLTLGPDNWRCFLLLDRVSGADYGIAYLV
jgi:hypothetical protein